MEQATVGTTVASEIPEIKALVADFDRRIRHLSDAVKVDGKDVAEASDETKELVRRTLDEVMSGVHKAAADVGEPVASEVSRVGRQAVGRVSDGIEQRPLMMLALAAGVGCFIGFMSRR